MSCKRTTSKVHPPFLQYCSNDTIQQVSQSHVEYLSCWAHPNGSHSVAEYFGSATGALMFTSPIKQRHLKVLVIEHCSTGLLRCQAALFDVVILINSQRRLPTGPLLVAGSHCHDRDRVVLVVSALGAQKGIPMNANEARSRPLSSHPV